MTYNVNLTIIRVGGPRRDTHSCRPYSVTADGDLRVKVVWHQGTATKEKSIVEAWLKDNDIPFVNQQSRYIFDNNSDCAKFMLFWGGQ